MKEVCKTSFFNEKWKEDWSVKKILIVFFGLFFISAPVYVKAARGCCSSHGGVDCSRIQANGNVVCNDGWTQSTCSYSSMAKCNGFNPNASTSQERTYVYGCTNQNAKNYNPNANKDDGSCIAYTYGCTNLDALNYDATAEKDDGSCIAKIYGCMDKEAKNYNENANIENNECEYQNEENIQNTTKASDSEMSTESIIGTTMTIGGLAIAGIIIYSKIKAKKEK